LRAPLLLWGSENQGYPFLEFAFPAQQEEGRGLVMTTLSQIVFAACDMVSSGNLGRGLWRLFCFRTNSPGNARSTRHALRLRIRRRRSLSCLC
jgi:hypothetical protein